MASPLITFGADTVSTAEILRTFCTAVLTQLTIGADFHAVFAFSALRTESGAVGTVFSAVAADAVGTITAVMAVLTHRVGTVHADAAVGTEFVHASGAFTALFADVFRTVRTDDAAVLADLRAFAALITFLAEEIADTFPAQITGCTELVTAR